MFNLTHMQSERDKARKKRAEQLAIEGLSCALKGCTAPKRRCVRSDTGHVYYAKYCGSHWRGVENDSVRRVDKHGYVHVKVDGVWRTEHRLVLEAQLGRPLRTGESAHHINGLRDDNRPENLELWVGPIRYGQRARDIVCEHCGMPYLAPPPDL